MAACYHDSKNELKHTFEYIGLKKRKIKQAEKSRSRSFYESLHPICNFGTCSTYTLLNIGFEEQNHPSGKRRSRSFYASFIKDTSYMQVWYIQHLHFAPYWHFKAKSLKQKK